MSVAAFTPTPARTAEPAPGRHLAVVRDAESVQDQGGIWTDETYWRETAELTAWLTGLARLDAEIMSL